ncbi:hypothetical protein H2C43_07200 [Corynebacterium glutamicum]|uniref:Uncharacterized protein n=1 Tax=Corynebacterium glutamicum (strain ATCC 13032 / DSM 20300 / JCM 1318 / BCRC 11384 / CCUG 27702 / LMG 3730 / NBRC 12168 / NCIMB 10025 / NRRL B-2784 / 534) TaxID=196627 RepID=Q8NPE0_CORGL|nr:hypothetical protein [Corynebacterium glutamicum]AUI01353.1 hypothetical protein CYL77_09465 [Corynebacterium glutamicum]AUI05001.1 hypothetical protein C0I99_13160 [Corynebacterium glutamicum]MBA4571794.1 hypothetical protein [Corynebacterium glutamicum]MBA4574729.1 hypothetical protein [Corynebacterium glutamicum]MBA4577658.1 hypothetical protein [Corynebacterium glutamicum]
MSRSYPIYIISFAPADDLHGVGGFEWVPASTPENKAAAFTTFDRQFDDSRNNGGSHIVRLLNISDPNITADMTQDDITAYLDSNIDRWESTEHALKQFVPLNAGADRVPTGGADEHITHACR